MTIEEFRPDKYYSGFWAIDFKELNRAGIENLIIDVDSTIADAHSDEIDERVKIALYRAMNAGLVKNACLVSNVMYGKRKVNRLVKMAVELDIPCVAAFFPGAKPSAGPFMKALKKMSAGVANTAVIGDQIFTDVLGGNRLGMFTILVQPLGKVHWTTRITLIRKRENRILRKLGVILDDGENLTHKCV